MPVRTIASLVEAMANTADSTMHLMAEPAWRVLQSARLDAAMRDPIYQHLVKERDRQHTENQTVDFDTFIAMQEIEQTLAPKPWWETPTRVARSRPLTRLFAEAKWAAQRLGRGWDDRAVWSLDAHLTGTLADQLDWLAEKGISYPGTEEFPTAESWRQALRRNASRLRAYQHRGETLERSEKWQATPEQLQAMEVALEQGAREALVWVADHLPLLWD